MRARERDENRETDRNLVRLVRRSGRAVLLRVGPTCCGRGLKECHQEASVLVGAVEESIEVSVEPLLPLLDDRLWKLAKENLLRERCEATGVLDGLEGLVEGLKLWVALSHLPPRRSYATEGCNGVKKGEWDERERGIWRERDNKNR
jgi:hypothetical protein